MTSDRFPDFMYFVCIFLRFFRSLNFPPTSVFSRALEHTTPQIKQITPDMTRQHWAHKFPSVFPMLCALSPRACYSPPLFQSSLVSLAGMIIFSILSRNPTFPRAREQSAPHQPPFLYIFPGKAGSFFS